LLSSMVDFEGAPDRTRHLAADCLQPLPPLLFGGGGGNLPLLAAPIAGREFVPLVRFPAIPAIWAGERVLRAGARSCVYGFTSNVPPTFANVRLQGIQAGIVPAEIELRDVALWAFGEVPTPIYVSEELAAAPLAGFAGGIGLMGAVGGGF